MAWVPRGWATSSTTSVILGMTSPPRSTATKSPMRTPRRAISSGLWRVARATVMPPMGTGARAATGVSLPVRPTWKRTSRSWVMAPRAGEFVGDGPAGGLAGEAEAALLGGAVDLDDDAVDFVAEGVAAGLGLCDEGQDFVDGADGAGAGIGAEAGGFEGVERGGLMGERKSGLMRGAVPVAVPEGSRRRSRGGARRRWRVRRCGWCRRRRCGGWRRGRRRRARALR